MPTEVTDMTRSAGTTLFRQLRQDVPEADAGLVGRYARSGDGAAFAELVRRHGPMALGVCGRALRNTSDAEDAFQATFLVLARKARALRRPELLAAWLYGVARRTAAKARTAGARRRAREGELAD